MGALNPGPGSYSIMFPQVQQQEPGREDGNGGPEKRGPALGAEIGSARLGQRREWTWPSEPVVLRLACALEYLETG